MHLLLCVMFQFSVLVHITHFHKCKRQNVQAFWNTRIEVEDRDKNTNTHTQPHIQRMTERRDEGESPLSHLWICHFATTVSVTFAKARNKMCVGMCVFMCIWMCSAVSVHMFSVCFDLLWSDQYYCLQSLLRGVRPCSFPFPPVYPPPSHDPCSSLNWLKMTR